MVELFLHDDTQEEGTGLVVEGAAADLSSKFGGWSLGQKIVYVVFVAVGTRLLLWK